MRALAGEVVALIMRLADGQRGLITHAQLLQCGLDGYAIKRLRELGWLRPVTRGVYLVGHAAMVPYAKETAAILAFAPGAIIVHRSALVVWKVREPGDAPDALDVHVGVRGRRPRPRDGFIVHHITELDPCDVGACERLRVSKPARALLESACELGTHETEKAVDEALALGLVDRPALLAVIARYPRHRGARILRELADPSRASEITASQAEKRYAKLLGKANAPPSRAQYWIGPYRVDRCWPELKLVVEIDGTQFHRDRKRMEEDNKRQDDLRRGGWAVTRFTRRQVVYEPEYVSFHTGEEIAHARSKLGSS